MRDQDLRPEGAGLDTFEPEPLPADHPLLGFANVVATPHVAWLSDAARVRLQREVALEATRFLSGEPLRCAAVNGRPGSGTAAVTC